mmetsp:Transcript_51714/g.155218  ORF Transcript_51714/g.155218 Transcript_51714/m.155218 type:complete len:88 (-) Transcript_51714:41-304(-)
MKWRKDQHTTLTPDLIDRRTFSAAGSCEYPMTSFASGNGRGDQLSETDEGLLSDIEVRANTPLTERENQRSCALRCVMNIIGKVHGK